MRTIRIGGVPEHYNFPFYQLFEEQPFIDLGYRIDWRTYTTGTGHMLGDLHQEVLDLAIVLTEGVITDRHAGNNSEIIAHYVKSPLIWGVHHHPSNHRAAKGVQQDTIFGISRYGSGSHLMAYLYARSKGIVLNQAQFAVVNNLPGAIASMECGMADLFLWEKYTTQPAVDKNLLQRQDEFPTPWEPFVLVAKPEFKQAQENFIDLLLNWLSKRCHTLKAHREETCASVSALFHLKTSDAEAWFDRVAWHIERIAHPEVFEHVEEALIEAGIIEPRSVSV
jgi:sulfonate transport system substrate-binding protein